MLKKTFSANKRNLFKWPNPLLLSFRQELRWSDHLLQLLQVAVADLCSILQQLNQSKALLLFAQTHVNASTHTHAHSRSKRRGESGWWRCVFSAGTRIITTPPPALFPFPPRSAAFLIVFEHRGSGASVILKTERDACANFLINAVVSEVPVNRCCCTVIHISMVVQRSSQRKTFTDLVLFT